MSKTRTCTVCGIEKNLEENFYRATNGKHGHYARCKECVMISRRKARTCLGCGETYTHIGKAGAKRRVCDTCAQVGRVCFKCDIFKPHENFYNRKPGQKGGHNYCRDGCSTSYNRELRYSVTATELAELELAAGGSCEVCGRSGRKMAVDHDHETGAVRGLICGSCNSGLGLFADNIAHLLGAVEYLRKHGSAA